ncbi:MAG TPA: ABC transporter ATP-binding protein [Ktedonobacterales bacterium]|nr:ABC transporter ATP-binding protein [Ktedonobacterales bacterium]
MSIDNTSVFPAPSATESVAHGAEPVAITIEHLTKTYGEHVAVRDLSFSVAVGQIFALLGPNGAGKTTTVEMLEGYRVPDGGSVRVLGLDPRAAGVVLKRQIGVMLQQDGLYPGLRAREVLDLYASFFDRPEEPDALLEMVGLRDAARTRCRQLSGGQKRRLALAMALVGRPTMLFLDEPTTGMDPQARHATWEIIRAIRERGATVLLTTHFMDEAERLADRIGIIDRGQLVALDTPAALSRIGSNNAVRFTAAPGLDHAALAGLPAASTVREEPAGTYTVETAAAPALLVELTTWLRDNGVELRDLRVGYGSLEEVFLRLTGREVRE